MYNNTSIRREPTTEDMGLNVVIAKPAVQKSVNDLGLNPKPTDKADVTRYSTNG